MYLCDRFPGNIPFFSGIIEKYCDIVTINYYPVYNPYSGINTYMTQDMNQFHRKIKNRPLYISEWSVVAMDSGLPNLNGAGLRVISQEQRAHSIQVLQLSFSSRDFIVGSDYFMFVDDPYEASENCNYGFKNEKDDIYEVMANYFKKVNAQTCARHMNGEYKDLYDNKNVDWINENNLKHIDIDKFSGSRNINFNINEESLLLIKYKNILLGNLYLLYECTHKNETFWMELDSYEIEKINENDYLYNLEIIASSFYAKIKFKINIPKSFKDQENPSWFSSKLSSFELTDKFEEDIIVNKICILFNSNIGDDGKVNDVLGNDSPIPSFYQNNYYIYDKNIKKGISMLPHGTILQFGKNNEKKNMEIVFNLEDKIKIKKMKLFNLIILLKVNKFSLLL